MESKVPVSQNKPSFVSLLNQPISMKRRAIKYPTKTTMNLSPREMEKNLSRVMPVVMICVLLAAALVKIGIVDRFVAVAQENAKLTAEQQQIDELDAQLTKFAEIRMEYQRCTKKYQTDQEAAIIDRIALLESIENAAKGLVQLSSVSVSEGAATVTVAAAELSSVAAYKTVLQSSEYVKSASVFNANTVEDPDTKLQYVTASIELVLSQEAAK